MALQLPSIMMVDDTPMFRNMFGQYIQTSTIADRVTLHTAESGFEAITRLEKAKPDLIFLDVQMPGMDGYQVCKLIKSNPKWQDVKIVFLTSAESLTDQMRGQHAGAEYYMQKPFSREMLIEQIELHIGSQRL